MYYSETHKNNTTTALKISNLERIDSDEKIWQDHQETQKLTCLGCGFQFDSACGLMSHIEREQCRPKFLGARAIRRSDLHAGLTRLWVIAEETESS